MTTEMPASIIWRGMTRAELDAAYNNSAAVADSAQTIAEWTARSARLRERHPELLDLVYGPRPRNRVDVFRAPRPAGVPAPLLVFIHGGYWQRNAKEMFACMAEGPMARGFDVALLGYTLAPDVTVTELVVEIHVAIRWLHQQTRGGEPPPGGSQPPFGGGKPPFGGGKMIVSGWSAGGHLTAMAMDLAEVDGGLAISGIFDLEPCRLNYLNDKLGLTADEAQALSPALHLPRERAPLVIACGGNELPELRRQSREYWQIRSFAGLPTTFHELAGHDHFSILEELASPDGRLTALVQGLLGPEAACA
jgi:arylformamidase